MEQGVTFRRVFDFLTEEGWHLTGMQGQARVFVSRGAPPLYLAVYARGGRVSEADWRAIQSFVSDAHALVGNGKGASRLRRKAS